MKYIYTTEDCSKCKQLKENYKVYNVQFVERSADRLKQPEDEIDKEALVQASLQNMELPVEVESALIVSQQKKRTFKHGNLRYNIGDSERK